MKCYKFNGNVWELKIYFILLKWIIKLNELQAKYPLELQNFQHNLKQKFYHEFITAF